MKPFVFSADSHILEPKTLFVDGLPPSLRSHAMVSRKQDDHLVTGNEHKVIYRLRVGAENDKVLVDTERKGIYNLDGRIEDMDKDGVNAEICFPSLGLWLYCIDDPEAEKASCEIYNKWNNEFFSGHLDRFVRCGILPVKDFGHTLHELNRLNSLGFTAAMLPAVAPTGVPKYNSADWDPIFEAAGRYGIVLVMHTGTGLESVQSERGPGGAVINYTSQMQDAANTASYLIAGGVLDRNPDTKVAFIESGASWLAALAERMDEVYDGHSNFVRPKLSARPSEIVRRQVYASFQHDRAAIMARSVTSANNIMWASDYPHAEGTFPMSPYWMEEVFRGIEGVTQDEKWAILGGNAVDLFRLPGRGQARRADAA